MLELKSERMVACPKCGSPALAHRACPTCGTYRGRVAVKLKTPKLKKEKKA